MLLARQLEIRSGPVRARLRARRHRRAGLRSGPAEEACRGLNARASRSRSPGVSVRGARRRNVVVATAAGGGAGLPEPGMRRLANPTRGLVNPIRPCYRASSRSIAAGPTVAIDGSSPSSAAIAEEPRHDDLDANDPALDCDCAGLSCASPRKRAKSPPTRRSRKTTSRSISTRSTRPSPASR